MNESGFESLKAYLADLVRKSQERQMRLKKGVSNFRGATNG